MDFNLTEEQKSKLVEILKYDEDKIEISKDELIDLYKKLYLSIQINTKIANELYEAKKENIELLNKLFLITGLIPDVIIKN